MMDEETRLDLVEAKEAMERADERCNDGSIGSARRHLKHAIYVLERILGRNAKNEGNGPE